MPKPEAWRMDPATYPVSAATETRFQDLDPLGHVNNVAMAALFENGRVRFNHTLIQHKRDDQRWLIAAVNIDYVDEAYFPAEVLIGNGIGRIGKRSWSILSAGFQKGRCVATCETTLVITGPERSRMIDDAFRSALEALRVKAPQA